ncbi:hypothetical protein TthTMY_08220 [Thermus thermophilus]|nr:hypothetical protein TthTMY_08220 [Thermus thermophilus]
MFQVWARAPRARRDKAVASRFIPNLPFFFPILPEVLQGPVHELVGVGALEVYPGLGHLGVKGREDREGP